MSLSLNIYAQESVEQQPSEAQLSAALAQRIGTPVLYPPDESPVSAHSLVTPEGEVIRARLPDPDDEEFMVTAVEAFVEQLPDVPVIHLPEVVRAQAIATPLSDSFAEAVANLSQDGQGEGAGAVTAEVAEVARFAESYLGAWEKLSRRAENNWEPSGWYPLDFYREVLEYRDDIEGYLRQLPESIATLYKRYVDKVDSLYQELTVEDKEHVVIGDSHRPITDSVQKAWWWYRRPEPMPWEE
ncbi:hypothetical protein T261_5741 [Streptomyces lydicus]|nr:hypothetical protein T261_5741 [Streptomyces lydicus]